MKYEKLIGWTLDTNQYSTREISSKEEAKYAIEKIISIYGENIMNYMFICDDKRFSTFAKSNEITLFQILN